MYVVYTQYCIGLAAIGNNHQRSSNIPGPDLNILSGTKIDFRAVGGFSVRDHGATPRWMPQGVYIKAR